MLGAGKTLSLTYLAIRNYAKGRKIYSNYKLKGIPFTPVTTLEQIENMKGGFFAGDEFWSWIDCRCSGAKKNKLISSILLKSRKRDVHIAYTLQGFHQIDKRVRTITDFVAIPMLSPNEKFCRLAIYNQAKQLIKMYKFKTAPVFKFYDTKEEVASLD